MTIHEFIWTEDRIEHIARHRVEPEEFEEVCFGRPMVLRIKATGKSPTYNVLGRTSAGRLLLCVVVAFSDGKGFPVTARTMTVKEEQRFTQWSRR